jgi:hypothetical protein
MKDNFREGRKYGTFKRVLGIYESQEEVLVIADYHYSSLTGSTDSIY